MKKNLVVKINCVCGVYPSYPIKNRSKYITLWYNLLISREISSNTDVQNRIDNSLNMYNYYIVGDATEYINEWKFNLWENKFSHNTKEIIANKEKNKELEKVEKLKNEAIENWKNKKISGMSDKKNKEYLYNTTFKYDKFNISTREIKIIEALMEKYDIDGVSARSIEAISDKQGLTQEEKNTLEILKSYYEKNEIELTEEEKQALQAMEDFESMKWNRLKEINSFGGMVKELTDNICSMLKIDMNKIAVSKEEKILAIENINKKLKDKKLSLQINDDNIDSITIDNSKNVIYQAINKHLIDNYSNKKNGTYTEETLFYATFYAFFRVISGKIKRTQYDKNNGEIKNIYSALEIMKINELFTMNTFYTMYNYALKYRDKSVKDLREYTYTVKNGHGTKKEKTHEATATDSKNRLKPIFFMNIIKGKEVEQYNYINQFKRLVYQISYNAVNDIYSDFTGTNRNNNKLNININESLYDDKFVQNFIKQELYFNTSDMLEVENNIDFKNALYAEFYNNDLKDYNIVLHLMRGIPLTHIVEKLHVGDKRVKKVRERLHIFLINRVNNKVTTNI